MLIICHVCAEFHNKTGETVLTVSPEMLTGFISAPEEIQEEVPLCIPPATKRLSQPCNR